MRHTVSVMLLVVAVIHLLPMVGVGFAWASILSLPYAMLADSVPAQKMGTYMGVFNFFIVIPQLIAATQCISCEWEDEPF